MAHQNFKKDYAHQEPETSSLEPRLMKQGNIGDPRSSTSHVLETPSPIELAVSYGHIQIHSTRVASI